MKFYIIGDREIVLAFKLTGISGTAAYTRQAVLDAFNRVTGMSSPSASPMDEIPKVLILTESVSVQIEDEVIAWQKTGRYPLIVEIPGLNGRLEGKRSLSDAIRDAVGVQV